MKSFVQLISTNKLKIKLILLLLMFIKVYKHMSDVQIKRAGHGGTHL
jgi:hypothetical protein